MILIKFISKGCDDYDKEYDGERRLNKNLLDHIIVVT